MASILAMMLVVFAFESSAAQIPERPTDCTEATSAGNIFIGHDCGEYASVLVSGRIIIRKPWSRANRANRGVRLRERRERGDVPAQAVEPTEVPRDRSPGPEASESTAMFGIDVSGGDKPGELDCGDFQYREDAEDLFAEQGWSATNDPYGLDGATVDDDGRPCESLPSRP